MPPLPTQIFITGGRGRLATLIADHFATAPCQVELFSRNPIGGFRPLSDLHTAGGFTGAEAVLHLAWSTLPATSEQHPGSEEACDLPLLERLLDGLAALPAERRPLFVFFSTGGAVYGNAPGRPNREDDPPHPIGHYGRGKLAAERLIHARAARDGLACCVLRISNPYGYPVPKTRVQGIIPHACRCLAENQPLPLWGDGSARKDFIYYTDFLAALEAVLAQRLTGTFNLAAGESHQVCEVLAAIESQTGRNLKIEARPAPAWDVQDSRLDISRLTQATGWRPRIPLSEGIRRTVVAYSSH